VQPCRVSPVRSVVVMCERVTEWTIVVMGARGDREKQKNRVWLESWLRRGGWWHNAPRVIHPSIHPSREQNLFFNLFRRETSVRK
jgi:hypothetical protein